MGTEIEAKLRVESLSEIELRLQAGHARFVAEQSQTDVYYDDPLRVLARGDRCLRVRHQWTADLQEVVLTYKGPKQADDFKKRQEIEIPIGDGDALDQMLTALGYRKAAVVEKRRRLWETGECLVALDDVAGLGTFVEIEGPDDRAIVAVQQMLGLAGLSHIPRSYASMVAAKRREQDDD